MGLLISILIFFGYVGFVWLRYGVQKSISDSYYRLPEKWRFVFSLFCFGFSSAIIFVHITPLLFASIVGIWFVGAAPDFIMKKEEEYFNSQPYSHFIGAVTSILFLQLSIFFDFAWYDLNILSIAAMGIVALFAKNKIWWVEMVAYITLIVLILNS